MYTNKNNKAKNKMFGKRPALRYGALALAVIMAAAVAVMVIPGDTEVTAAYTANHSIDLKDLNSTYIAPTGATWNDTTKTLTFDSLADNLTYEITQTTSTRLTMSIVFDGVANTTAVIKNIQIAGIITLTNNAELNLLLTGSNDISGGSVRVPTGTTIVIDSADTPGSNTGSLKVEGTATAAYAAIGGNSSNVGTITISGGTVTATGGYRGGAGIGGGTGDSGGTITISGGTVTATGGYSGGAGIGGGKDGSGGTITISGGTVEANGSTGGAAIGGGDGGNAGTITISGGTVSASAGHGAGIGGGNGGNGGTITISGGKVTAASSSGAGIGGGKDGSGTVLTLGDDVSVGACSGGNLPAIQISSMGSANKGYFVNAHINVNLPSTALLFFPDGRTDKPSATILTVTAVDYRNFAVVFKGTTSKDYNIYAGESELVPVLRSEDNSKVIPSINQKNGYNAYNSNANDAVLPVKLPAFVAVTNIKLGSSTANVGTDFTLNGTVTPSNASYNTIVWTVKSAGTTGATISGNTLTTTETGKVTVTATIANGKEIGTAYTQDFEITVKGEGTSIWLWVGIVIAIIAIAVIALFILNRMGKVNIKLKP